MDSFRKASLLLSVVYGAAWSFISLMRYYSFNAGVFDLGVAVAYAKYIFTSGVSGAVQGFFLKGIAFLTAPVMFAFNMQGALVLQSFALGLGGYAVYGIAERELKHRWASIAIAASYLIYFPLSGVNWFDFHYQALFIPLFLYGYYFFIKGMHRASLAAMALSAISRYPYTVFPLMFSIYLILRKDRRTNAKLWAPLLAFTVAIFIGNIAIHGLYGASLGTIASAPPLYASRDYSADAYAILLILAPVLFLPLVSKWALFLVPFIAMSFISPYGFYHFPLLFISQYNSMVVPFVFLGAIDGLRRLSARVSLKAASVMVFVSVVSFASVYQPYSPLVGLTGVPYSVSEVLNPNMVMFEQSFKLLSLVPPKASVLVQNNIPQAYATYYSFTPYDNVFYNASSLPEFILAGPYSRWYWEVPASPALPMQEIVSMATSKGYGIYAEADGMVLLKEGYSGKPVYYYPYSQSFSASQLEPTAPWYYKDGLITASNVQQRQIWFGPEMFIPPGVYTMTVYMKGVNMSPTDYFGLIVAANNTLSTVSVYYINGRQFTGSWQTISFNFTVPELYQNVELIGFAYRVTGTVYVSGVYIAQDAM